MICEILQVVQRVKYVVYVEKRDTIKLKILSENIHEKVHLDISEFICCILLDVRKKTKLENNMKPFHLDRICCERVELRSKKFNFRVD